MIAIQFFLYTTGQDSHSCSHSRLEPYLFSIQLAQERKALGIFRSFSPNLARFLGAITKLLILSYSLAGMGINYWTIFPRTTTNFSDFKFDFWLRLSFIREGWLTTMLQCVFLWHIRDF